MKNGVIFGVGAAAVVALAGAANAYVVYFENITNNGSVDVAGALECEITEDAGGLLCFEFRNTGPLDSSITDIYFDDDAGFNLQLELINNGPGVSFSEGANPNNLPSGNTIGFDATFGMDSDNPPPQNGVNPGEFVVACFAPATTLDALIAAIEEGDFRIGLHVQSIANDGNSDSFVNVPTPGATALLALSGLVAARRRRA